MRTNQLIIIFCLAIVSFSCDDNLSGYGYPTYDTEGNLAIDREKIDTYLETAQYDSLYRIHDPSGVVIIVTEEGTGSRPVSGNVVYTNYTGYLLDGTVFDSNLEDVALENDIYDEDRNYDIFSFFLGQSTSNGGAIQGFTYGFQRIRSGAKATIIIPSPYAYQDNESVARVPANSVLVFDVDFLGMD
ncbi:FKBP-type peptidyl-prolyl cis-trans isomerase [Cyclobacterium sp. 1_MG-2023]|uniref:FKBP-type peptidyl-prolyl cis-trans isomerase n=1 Tax=Cyclobacterium sp. 1_MG-2023 TaxID=3062681 RepID=UPI0026E311E3|nr:FKBP-type peptidyl-prolyl cis-trans isomerase [Cyclobacterium sp. 1_MG-2023]MDO6437965.1 FKBP-type peptidyl-prolyl cis-trans isomerase [Cyclobacterium sp. 1_MG-2023]|eukprot:TRINITY_DN70802_c0_g1_i1.p2 TRINITY_DN70802_c0_g1~~TRINITY_DN70802_c0_g1_i1.p2  ORF type:complete len:187 (+),score=3.14 TRINITY_DN70802_c0_g1_i1:1996-2556(+)